MKKSLAILVLLNLCFVFIIPISAQRLNSKSVKTPNPAKNSLAYSSAEAFSDGGGVWLEWETSVESGNLGFNVYRINNGEKELVSSNLIPGNYLKTGDAQAIGNKYTFFDPNGDTNSVYYIESLSTKGEKQTTDLIVPKYVRELDSITGSSSETLRKNDSNKSNSTIVRDDVNIPPTLESSSLGKRFDWGGSDQLAVASQPGVKIGVKKEGFYRVSNSDLQNAGFDVKTPSANWQLYKNGVQQAIFVGKDDSYIEFYGTGLDNRDTDTQIYFLINGEQPGSRIRTVFRRPFAGNVLSNSYSQTTTFKERTININDIFNGDDKDNFFGRVLTPNATTVNLTFTGVDFSAAASFDLSIQGLTEVAHQTKIVVNGTEIGSISGTGKVGMSRHFDIPTSVLREGTNSFQLTTVGGSSDYSVLDLLQVNYSRAYLAKQNQLSFYVPNYKASYLDGFTSANIRVFDISNSNQPSIVSNLTIEPNNAGGYRVYLPSNRGTSLFAVEDSAIMSADSITNNVPSSLATTAHNANMIIISYRDWMNEANSWANYRRAQGMTVEVVNIEDVYDEFSYGVYSADAIKSFLQYAYNNWQTKPGYVLLLGDATYNPRNYADTQANSGAFNYIPTKMVETIYLETGSDEAMADFDNDGLAEIPIGRIPVHDAQTVTDVLSKVSTYEQTIAAQNLSRGVLFASDVPNGYDFQGVSNRLRNQLSASVPTVMINKADADAHTNLITQLNSGKFMVNYSGHGNSGAWSASPALFTNEDAAALTNFDKLTVFTMLTCLNGYFINPSDSLSEVLIKKQMGGAVSVWASTGLTTPDIQEIMATRYYSQVNAGTYARIGDLIKDAKTAIPAGRDVRLSWALIGDPALKIK